MPVAQSIIDKLIPLSTLSQKNKKEIAESADFHKAQAGTLLFSKGDKNSFYIYLNEGAIELLDGSKVISLIETSGKTILHPIDNTNPRQFSAVCKRNSVILKLDSSLVELMTTWEKTGTFEVEEINFEAEKTMENSMSIDSDDWMTSLLQLRIFKKIPPDNLHNIFLKFEKIECKAGEKIINQGDVGDAFYVILKGKCIALRSTPKNPNGVKLGLLNPGDSFGGDGLISNTSRNSSVINLSQGTLLKLPKEVFLSSMVEPLTPTVSYEELKAGHADGSAVIFDIRNPDEYVKNHIAGSSNVPLILLRIKLPPKPMDKKILCVCQDELQSRAACYVLREKGYDSYVLNGGLAKVPKAELV